ncbi:MAG: hypothetical protein ACKVU4_15515 [Phycisphaerales bacterium]
MRPTTSYSACAGCLIALLSSGMDGAVAAEQQALRQADQPIERPATVPTEILYYPSGKIDLLTRPLGALEPLPQSVPVYSFFPDGRKRAGLWITNTSDQPIAGVPWEQPVLVWLSDHWQWQVTRQRCLLTFGDARLPPQDAWSVRSTATLPVHYTPAAPPRVQIKASDAVGPWTLILNPDIPAFQAAFGAEQTQQMQAAVARTAARFERLLELSVGSVTIDIVVEVPPDPNLLAVTAVNHVVVDHDLVLQTVILSTDNEFQPQGELSYYNAMNPQQVPFRHTGNTIFQATSAGVASALLRHLNANFNNPPPHAVIQINPNSVFDFNALDGPAPGFPNTVHDFEGLLNHELIHALGFTTTADIAGITDTLVIWDWCRFSESAGPAISAAEATSDPRELRPEIEAIYGTLLNSPSSTFPAARGTRPGGDDDGANHWRSLERLNPMIPVGIMDPAGGDAAILFGFRQIRKPDLQAIDIIGWNLNPNGFTIGGGPPVPQQPANGQPRVSVAPTLQWDGGTDNERWHVFVWDGASPGVGTPVFSATDLFSTSVTVPASTPLKPGRVYSWRATGENVAGYLYAVAFTFETCYPDCNQDASLGAADFGCFQSKYVLGDPYADCNASGSLTVADFGCFQAQFVVGCP